MNRDLLDSDASHRQEHAQKAALEGDEVNSMNKISSIEQTRKGNIMVV